MRTMNGSRVTGATLLLLLAVFGSACSSTATKSGASSPPAAGGAAPDAGGVSSNAADAGAVDGHDARQYTCDSFSAADLLAAVQTIAPATTAGSVAPIRLADEFGDPLVCDFLFTSNRYPDLALTEAEAQDMTFIITIEDGSVDGIPTPQAVRDLFATHKAYTSGSVNGDATSDHQSSFASATGFGEGAFFDDYYTRNVGISEAVASNFSVLRASLPMSVEVDLDYSAQSGAATATPATGVDPFQPDILHAIIEVVTNVVLTKVS
ncbi:MAG: hypothetical protein JWL72_647 [Ilumatobacteraceae bacterium]|nr:hypothetical protein [Ilumatobacteraceae bacterium]MCU1387309.1 hypothetical protein [Ilumatobacteraceae bacterium]